LPESFNIDAVRAEAEAAYDADDYAKAFPLYRKMADTGDSEAQFFTAWMLELGYGTSPSTDEAKKRYFLAGEKGYARAWLFLGRLQEHNGEIQEAVESYERAAQQGNLVAMYRLGWRYRTLKTDPHYWLNRAAQQGHTFSLAHLGRLIYRGEIKGHRTKGILYIGQAIMKALVIILRGGRDALDNDERLQKE
jgi:tetratricopeptide (TPR) repeat protein